MDSNQKEQSFREKRIRGITNLYYSRPEIQKAIFEFCKNREICPRYFEGFGKRPDSFQYPGDIFEIVKKGATSFHCSEEIWKDPLSIKTGMSAQEQNNLRKGWDLLIDIDCKWFEYSKKAADSIIKTLKINKIKNIGVKFSGSKGFHIIVPWKAFPKEINDIPTKDLFPELPRKIASYLRYESEKIMRENLSEDFEAQFKNTNIKKGIKCNNCREISNEFRLIEFFCDKCKSGEIKKIPLDGKKDINCPNCRKLFDIKNERDFYECPNCNINSRENPENFSSSIQSDLFDLMGLDIVLVSPRHLFRTPYSLHEKTSLASIVINPSKILEFDIKSADPIKLNKDSIKNFLPDSIEEEGKKLVLNALDWSKQEELKKGTKTEALTGKFADFKPIKLDDISEKNFPPCLKNILKGVKDGRKRALFVLINIFRSIGMEKEDIEKNISDWNKKNEIPLKEGYITSQLLWSFKRKPLMPQNCREFYQGIGVCLPDELCNKIKNPVNYIIKKNLYQKKSKKSSYKKAKKTTPQKNKSKDNFKKNI